MWRMMLIAVVTAFALTLCVTQAGNRLSAFYDYSCLACGHIGGVASDGMARWLQHMAHAPSWLVYVASYTVFFLVNAVVLFALLWFATAAIKGVTRVVVRKRPLLSRT